MKKKLSILKNVMILSKKAQKQIKGGKNCSCSGNVNGNISVNGQILCSEC